MFYYIFFTKEKRFHSNSGKYFRCSMSKCYLECKRRFSNAKENKFYSSSDVKNYFRNSENYSRSSK